MKKLIFILFLLSAFSLNAAAQRQDDSKTLVQKVEGAVFKSDGCSMFPDGKYLDCCVEHDQAYFAGGSWSARWRADKKLMKCVAAKKGWFHKPLSRAMWLGVRIGGAPFLPTPFRWGFGRAKIKKIKRAESIKTLARIPLKKLI